jgi:hypothetical protein
MKTSYAVIAIIACLTCVSVSGQATQEPTKRTVQGTVEVENDCPVALSNVWMEVAENQPPPYRSAIQQEQVEITNRSHRDIKKIGLAIIQEFETGELGIVFPSFANLKTGETRTAVFKGSTKTSFPKLNATLKIRVTGVSFADGTRWVPPRSTELHLFFCTLRHPDTPLLIVKCNNLEKDHRFRLSSRANNIAAFRLGVVKDTPQTFAVKLGEWVNLDAATVVKKNEFEIASSANQTGLKQSDFYPFELFTRYTQRGEAMKIRHGVAMFVAEVKFADGTIWKQDLRREYLIWSER